MQKLFMIVLIYYNLHVYSVLLVFLVHGDYCVLLYSLANNVYTCTT